jgi:hypothetical protein
MLLKTTFVELRAVAGKRRTRAGRPHAVSGRPMLIHTCHAMPRCAVALRCRFQNGMVAAWHGHGTARHGMCESNTAALCKSNGKNTTKTLSGTARHDKGMGAAWERHGVSELALIFATFISTAPMVTRTGPNVTFYVRCLSCFLSEWHFRSFTTQHKHVLKL